MTPADNKVGMPPDDTDATVVVVGAVDALERPTAFNNAIIISLAADADDGAADDESALVVN